MIPIIIDGRFLAKRLKASMVGVLKVPISSPKYWSTFSVIFLKVLCTSSGRCLPKFSSLCPISAKSCWVLSHISGTSLTKSATCSVSFMPRKYPAKITSAITEMMTKADPALRFTLNCLSKKRTSGLAISAMIHPMTKGIK